MNLGVICLGALRDQRSGRASYYNWCRPHKTLSKPYRTTPAMAAGLADEVYSVEWLSDLVSAQYREPGSRGPYRPRQPQSG